MAGRKQKKRPNKPKGQPQQKKPEAKPEPVPPATDTAPVTPTLNEQPQAIEAASGDPTTQQQDDRKRPFSLRRALKWSIVLELFFAGCLVAFTLCQAVVGYWQWDATNDQYNAMTRQLDLMEIDQRPWIEVGTPIREEEGGRDFTCTFTNRGKTPAYVNAILRVCLEHEAWKSDPDPTIKNFLEQDKNNLIDMTEVVIAPGASYLIRFSPIGWNTAPFPEGTDDTRDLHVRFGCRVMYRDSGRNNHTTEQWFTATKSEKTMEGYWQYGKMD